MAALLFVVGVALLASLFLVPGLPTVRVRPRVMPIASVRVVRAMRRRS